MAHWKSTKRQRGRVKAHEAKADGRRALRAEANRAVDEAFAEMDHDYEPLVEWRGLWLAKWQVDLLTELEERDRG